MLRLLCTQDNFSYYLQSEDGAEDVDDWVESIKWAKYSALKVRAGRPPYQPRLLDCSHSANSCCRRPTHCVNARVQAGYFRLDDINAKLKEQVEHAEALLRQERERSGELELQSERLRRSGGGDGGLDSEATAHLATAHEIEQLQEQLRQMERERDQALRRAAGGGASKGDDECFEPTRSGMLDSRLCRSVQSSS